MQPAFEQTFFLLEKVTVVNTTPKIYNGPRHLYFANNCVLGFLMLSQRHVLPYDDTVELHQIKFKRVDAISTPINDSVGNHSANAHK